MFVFIYHWCLTEKNEDEFRGIATSPFFISHFSLSTFVLPFFVRSSAEQISRLRDELIIKKRAKISCWVSLSCYLERRVNRKSKLLKIFCPNAKKVNFTLQGWILGFEQGECNSPDRTKNCVFHIDINFILGMNIVS